MVIEIAEHLCLRQGNGKKKNSCNRSVVKFHDEIETLLMVDYARKMTAKKSSK